MNESIKISIPYDTILSVCLSDRAFYKIRWNYIRFMIRESAKDWKKLIWKEVYKREMNKTASKTFAFEKPILTFRIQNKLQVYCQNRNRPKSQNTSLIGIKMLKKV